MYHKTENGNVLFMILIAVVLLGALTYAMTGSKGDESTTSVSAGRIAEDLQNQAQTIRSALLECKLTNYRYPEAVAGMVKDLKCRINDSEERDIFSGSASRILPIPPKPFEDWQYANPGGTDTDISISIATPAAKAGLPGVKSALGRMKEAYATGEADIVNDGATASFVLHITKP